MNKEKDQIEQDELLCIRHSLAHVMAQAVMEMFAPGEAKIGIGPAVKDGFYYDFDLPRNLTSEDLKGIEKRMRQIISGKHAFDKRIVSSEEAKVAFQDQPYKLELIEALASGEADEHGEPLDSEQDISLYTQDGFTDLCRGPHVEHSGQINPSAFKLLNIAGAYWRGDENNPQLQRLYGTAWKSKEQLKAHLSMLEEAKKRDHRKLGRELSLFVFNEEVGPGLPLWTPKGTAIIEELEKLAGEMERKYGYEQVRTPHITKEDLFLRSGHLPYYAEDMYPPMKFEGTDYYLKPMNCPFHHKIFASKTRSYRDMPIRLTEYGTCYRYEKSGQLFGLMRVRMMQMNDAHIYVREDQFEDEFMAVVSLYMEYFRLFDIKDYVMRLGMHSKKGLGVKYVDNERLWLKTEEMVRRAMRKGNVPFIEAPDEAAFYGPKIDVQVWSAIGKEFSLATNQVDFAVPVRFDLSYTNKEGEEEIPLCLHRAPLSTHERLIGFLIEHYAGRFPVWLSPDQVWVIPVTDTHVEYASSIANQLFDLGIRVEANLSSGRMNAKIRQAQKMKVPYMLIVGDNEMQKDTVSLRKRDGSRLNDLAIDDFIELIQDRIVRRAAEL
jgi:threonyl-tRNA synthetase